MAAAAHRPLISIIIPTLNEAGTIQVSLSNIQAHRPRCEILVVDGGSADQTVALALPLADQVFTAEKGRAKQMNFGAQQAKGELLLFLHADTCLPDQALELIGKLPAHYQWGRFDIELTGAHPLLKIIARMMNLRSRLTGIATGDQAIFTTREAFNAVGRYTEIALMEDIDLSRKLKRISPPYCIEAKVISSARRWEQFGVSKTMLLMWSLRLRFFLGENPEKLAKLYSGGRFW